MGKAESKTPQTAAVARVANRQQGNVTHAQLVSAGFTNFLIHQRIRAGWLFRVHPRVYAVGRPPHTPIQRASAAVLACGPGAALSHLGALALWGFARTEWPRRFDVIATTDRRPENIKVHHYQRLTPADFRTHLGVRATSPARTVLDCARRLDDAARARAVNDGLHSHYLTDGQLADVRRRFPHHPGARLLDPFIDHPAGITRSPLEDEFLAFCERYDLPRPQTNLRLDTHTVDALFPEHGLIVELDSWEYHRTRQDFENDREREPPTSRPAAAPCASPGSGSTAARPPRPSGSGGSWRSDGRPDPRA